MIQKEHERIIGELLKDLEPLRFSLPVTHVYNPLKYALKPYLQYLDRFGNGKKEVVLIGMNPGPWGMAQTGIPFGEVKTVKEWLHLKAAVGRPEEEHPARPVTGLSCTRSEVSGKRLWGWARIRFRTPERFFARFFVANYCPLMFMEETGKNRTPDRLKAHEKPPLFEACDRALRETINLLEPEFVLGIGNFAAHQARIALKGMPITLGKITHPSPANPKANKGWEGLIEAELVAQNVRL